MAVKIRGLVCTLLCFLSTFCLAQHRSVGELISALNKIPNDSLALVSLDSLVKTKLNTRELLVADLCIVIRSFISQRFEKAITVANEAIVIAHGHKMDSMEAAINEHLGNTYYYMDNRPKAIPYYKRSIELSEKNNYWQMEASCYNNLSAIFIDTKDYKQGETYLLKSLGIMESHGMANDDGAVISRRILATLYASTGRLKEAEAIYLNFIEKGKRERDTTLLYNNLIYYSKFLNETHDSIRAAEISAEAMKYMKRATDFQGQLVGLEYHAKNLETIGRHKEAYLLMGEYNSILKKSFVKDLNKQISEVEVKYKTAEIQKEKEQAEEDARRQQRIYLVSFLCILILLGAGAYVIYQRRNARQKAAAHKERLEALIDGEEKERSRIARDLHDGIVQDLTAIKLKINSKNQNAGEDVVNELDRATKEVRNIAYQMMPVALREYGLVPALEQLLEKSLSTNNIRFDFDTANIEERLPEKIEVCLYRITQELINNVIKHSKASMISLVITRYHDAVTLVLEDNGKGFKENEIQKGIGMNSLSSRLEMVNGNLKFESVEGTGTIAIIKIPFPSLS